MSAPATTALGVHSEVGTLRTVIVHRPDIAHERLSPTNCHELLFDDVIWVRRARQEHDAFVDLMREYGVEVLVFHDLLAETLEDKKAREVDPRAAAPPRGGDGGVLGAAHRVGERAPRRRPGDDPDRWADGAGAAGRHPHHDRPGDAADRLRAPAATEPAVHARHERLALRRRVDQPDVLAGPAARDAEPRGRLPVPSAFRRRRVRRSGTGASTTTGAPPRSRAATRCRPATGSC